MSDSRSSQALGIITLLSTAEETLVALQDYSGVPEHASWHWRAERAKYLLGLAIEDVERLHAQLLQEES